MNVRFFAASTLLGCFALACSPGPVPVSQSPRDPSNPSAPEGVVPQLGSAPQGAAGAAPAGSASAVYACPMHPEITATAPGRCPKCGMNLAAKK